MKRILASLSAALLILLFGFVLAVKAEAAGGVPVCENLELKTRRNTPVEGQLIARDPDGDAVSFVITTKPVRGEVRLLEDGSFVYTPWTARKSRDYFGYRASDAEGNVSEEATAIIRID